MWSSVWQGVFLGFVGVAAGFAVAGGVFTVFTAVGLVPRFADRINGAEHILLFENMIILGVFFGIIVSLYGGAVAKVLHHGSAAIAENSVLLGEVVSIGQQFAVAVYAVFTGCYVSCLALSVAEIFDAIPIMARRARLKKGIGIVLLMLAIGKVLGSLFYYLKTFSETMV